jgi:putative transposase
MNCGWPRFRIYYGPEYTSHRFRPFVRAMGLIPCHTPRRSPQSNGLAEAFFGSFKRDYVYQACLETLEEVGQQVPAWIDHYNREAPHSALNMQSSVYHAPVDDESYH